MFVVHISSSCVHMFLSAVVVSMASVIQISVCMTDHVVMQMEMMHQLLLLLLVQVLPLQHSLPLHVHSSFSLIVVKTYLIYILMYSALTKKR